MTKDAIRKWLKKEINDAAINSRRYGNKTKDLTNDQIAVLSFVLFERNLETLKTIIKEME